MQTRSNVKPSSNFEIEEHANKKCDVLFFANIEESIEDGETTYIYDFYRLSMRNRNNLKEAVTNNYETWLEFAKNQEENKLAEEIRQKRNKLLEETDSEMCLDRMNLEVPEGTSFSSWLTFLKTIANAISGDMAKYRQELRDITKQEGFPYDVKFPKKPTKEE